MTEHNKNNTKHIRVKNKYSANQNTASAEYSHNKSLVITKTQKENILLDHLIFLHDRYVTSQSSDQEQDYCVSPVFYVNIFSSMNRFAQSKGITYNMSIHSILMNII